MTHNERNLDERHDGGPFSGPRLHERPWAESEAQGPFERRRAGDRRASEVEAESGEEVTTGRRRHWGRRKADVLSSGGRSLTAESRKLVRRFREPLIGLTLAGVAAPLINAGAAVENDSGTLEDRAESATRPAGNLEDGVGEAWADAEAESVRASTIEGAMVRYEIDRALAEEIYEAAERHEIEPDVAFGLVYTESTFRDRAVSHVGARGLTQVMPRTARWLDPSVSAAELFDRETNLDLGFKYLRMMIDKYGGDVENALTAYNRGPGTVDKILRRGGNPDNGYAGKVLGG